MGVGKLNSPKFSGAQVVEVFSSPNCSDIKYQRQDFILRRWGEELGGGDPLSTISHSEVVWKSARSEDYHAKFRIFFIVFSPRVPPQSSATTLVTEI